MKRILIATAMCLWVVSLAAISSADTLIMSDGTRVQGTVVGITTRTITFRHVDGITRRYSSSQVQGVEFLSAEHPRPGALSGRSVAVRAGKDLLLRTAETVDSHPAEPNRTGSAIAGSRRPTRQSSGSAKVPAGSPENPIFQHDVPLPSATFRAYVEGELVRVSIPSNWRELPGSNAVTFAPEGAYGSVGARSVFTHGIAMGLARNDKRTLRMTTGDFIQSYVLVPPRPGQTFLYRRVTISDRPGLHTVLSTVSEATREPERIGVFTTLLRDSTLFYVLAVAPRDCASDYADTFRRVIESIQIMDCDRCVP